MTAATCLLAQLHTSFHAIAGRLFAGDLDRATVFALLLNVRLSSGDTDRPISINSAAMSLGRPFETVRRHVGTLIAQGLCRRDALGVRIASDVCAQADLMQAMDQIHDIVVRYVEDAVRAGLVTRPASGAPRAFDRADGVRTAIDIVLAMADQHRTLIPIATDLALVYGIIAATADAADAPPGVARPRTVRVATLARLFSIAESTVRRRVAALSRPGRPLIRTANGLAVAPEWMERLDAAVRQDGRHGTLALGMGRIAAAGFPFADPASAYIAGRPALTFR
ncbi:hypothetical protein [Sphingomonas adhaesiva]|uniref:hypothetical protein n=1 Tax=Sphingomonas adhaesiva TaxID=28212 RepID=UPI002FF5A7CB